MVRKLRVRTGCFQCKERRKKCDEGSPKCSSCRRMNLVCRYPDPHAPSVEDLSKSDLRRSALGGLIRNAADIAQTADPGTLVRGFDDPAVLHGSATSIIRETTDKDIFAYLCAEGSTILRYPTRLFPASSNINTFRLGFPMARQIPAHLNALLSVAAAHRRHIQPQFLEHAMKHQALAVSGLRQEIARTSSVSGPPEWVCGTAAVLCMYELVTSDSIELRLTHLKGFYYMVELRAKLKLPWSPFNFLVDNYLHSFVINVLWHFEDLAANKPISFVTDFLLTTRGSKTPLGREVVGVPQELTVAVYKLSYLTYQDIKVSPWDAELLAVLRLIQNWRLSDHALAPSASGLLLVGKMYHIACMCYVSYLVRDTGLLSDQHIASYVKEAVLLLRLSGIERRPFNCLSWPLVILAIFATDPEDYQVLIQCLDAFTSISRMAGYQPAIRLVRKVWQDKVGPRVLYQPDLLRSVAI